MQGAAVPVQPAIATVPDLSHSWSLSYRTEIFSRGSWLWLLCFLCILCAPDSVKCSQQPSTEHKIIENWSTVQHGNRSIFPSRRIVRTMEPAELEIDRSTNHWKGKFLLLRQRLSPIVVMSVRRFGDFTTLVSWAIHGAESWSPTFGAPTMYWYSKYPSVLGTLLLPILFSPYRTQVTLARHLNYSSKKRGKRKKERKKRKRKEEKKLRRRDCKVVFDTPKTCNTLRLRRDLCYPASAHY